MSPGVTHSTAVSRFEFRFTTMLNEAGLLGRFLTGADRDTAVGSGVLEVGSSQSSLDGERGESLHEKVRMWFEEANDNLLAVGAHASLADFTMRKHDMSSPCLSAYHEADTATNTDVEEIYYKHNKDAKLSATEFDGDNAWMVQNQLCNDAVRDESRDDSDLYVTFTDVPAGVL
ncbi:hypothetical protein KEM55_009052 [Ascosphaera atra]|nr:hypothetical protein KEM55_009052 [Ascosphaera atra]